MKITIELETTEHHNLQKMADYLGFPIGQVIESLISGQVVDFMKRPSDSIWYGPVYYLSEKYGDTARLRRLCRFLDAAEENNCLHSTEERAIHFGDFKTLETWEFSSRRRN